MASTIKTVLSAFAQVWRFLSAPKYNRSALHFVCCLHSIETKLKKFNSHILLQKKCLDSCFLFLMFFLRTLPWILTRITRTLPLLVLINDFFFFTFFTSTKKYFLYLLWSDFEEEILKTMFLTLGKWNIICWIFYKYLQNFCTLNFALTNTFTFNRADLRFHPLINVTMTF